MNLYIGSLCAFGSIRYRKDQGDLHHYPLKLPVKLLVNHGVGVGGVKIGNWGRVNWGRLLNWGGGVKVDWVGGVLKPGIIANPEQSAGSTFSIW
jgi:hypothetical protein